MYEIGPVVLGHTYALCSDDPQKPDAFCSVALISASVHGNCHALSIKISGYDKDSMSVAGDELHSIFEDHRLFLVINVVLNLLLQTVFRQYLSLVACMSEFCVRLLSHAVPRL